jgi:hypothetical protein
MTAGRLHAAGWQQHGVMWTHPRYGAASFTLRDAERAEADPDRPHRMWAAAFAGARREWCWSHCDDDHAWTATRAEQHYEEYLSRCDDCRMPTTFGVGGRSEYYMVHDRIWEAATADEVVRDLCIGCLERRLRRTLTRDDFADVPANWDPVYMRADTRRLAQRKTATRSHPVYAEGDQLTPTGAGSARSSSRAARRAPRRRSGRSARS